MSRRLLKIPNWDFGLKAECPPLQKILKSVATRLRRHAECNVLQRTRKVWRWLRGYAENLESRLSQTEKRFNNKLNQHMASSPEIDPKRHRWEVSALTTEWLETEHEIEIGLKLTVKWNLSQLSSQQNKNLCTLIDGEPILIDTQWHTYK